MPLRLGIPEKSGSFRGNHTRRPCRSCKSYYKKVMGKSYCGESNVQFDERELEIEPAATTPVVYSTVNGKAPKGINSPARLAEYFLYSLKSFFRFN